MAVTAEGDPRVIYSEAVCYNIDNYTYGGRQKNEGSVAHAHSLPRFCRPPHSLRTRSTVPVRVSLQFLSSNTHRAY